MEDCVSTIEEILRKEIEVSTGQRRRENPLLTIGLSPGILSISISDVELFSIVRAFAKRVLAKIHPDKVGEDPRPEIANQRKEIIDAFDYLDSEQHFLSSLEEFRGDYSLERQEVTTLRARIVAFETNNRRLAERNTELEGQRLEAEQLKARLELQVQKAERAEAIALNTAPALEQAAEEAEDRRNKWHKLFKRRTKTLDGVIRSVRQLEMYIAAERWVFPPIGVTQPLLPWKVSAVGVLVFEIREKKISDGDLMPEVFPEDPEELAIYTRCRAMLENRFTSYMKDFWFLTCRFERIPVHRGEITTIVPVKIDREITLQKRTEVLAGSLSLEKSLKAALSELERLPDREVFKNLAPFLFPGRVLATMRRKLAPQVSEKYKITEDTILSDLQPYRIHESGSRKRLFRTHRILISVK